MELNIYNPEFSLQISDVCRNVWIARVSNFVTVAGNVVIMYIILAIVVIDVTSIPFCFFRHGFPKIKDFNYLKMCLFFNYPDVDSCF